MNDKLINTYKDRATGELLTEKIYASAFLYWSYNTWSGKFATDLVFKRKSISRLYAWCNKRKWSKRKIKPFIEKANVNLDDMVRPIEDYGSFNDFFIRDIDLARRPTNSDPFVCIAPVDGKVLAYPLIRSNMTFRIKRCSFTLNHFLRSDSLAEKFDGGSMIISRLGVREYHHFHFPDSGIPHPATPIKGSYYAGGPYSLHSLLPMYSENYRMITLFDSDHFGKMAIIEIAAFTVGSIRQQYQPDTPVNKGEHKGFFEIGGSTVVLLFQNDTITLDDDLCTNTKNDLETYVVLGDSIGRAQN